MGWKYVSIPKLHNRWSLGMDNQFHPTLYQACDGLSMLGSKLNHVSKRGPSCQLRQWNDCCKTYFVIIENSPTKGRQQFSDNGLRFPKLPSVYFGPRSSLCCIDLCILFYHVKTNTKFDHHFADIILECILLYEYDCILIQISVKFVWNLIPIVQLAKMARWSEGDKPLSEIIHIHILGIEVLWGFHHKMLVALYEMAYRKDSLIESSYNISPMIVPLFYQIPLYTLHREPVTATYGVSLIQRFTYGKFVL